MKMHLATLPASMLKQKPRRLYYAGQKRLFLFVIALAILPLLAIPWQTARLYQESWLAKTGAEMAGAAASRKELIDRFLISQEDALAAIVELYGLETLRRQDELARIFAAVNRAGVMTDMGVIDREGNHLAYVGPFASELAGRNYAEASWFAGVMRSGRYISDVFTGYRNVPHLIVAVTDREKGMILRATINSEIFNALVASANVGPGGDAYIISREGELQTPSRMKRAKLDRWEVSVLHEIAAGPDRVQLLEKDLYAVVPINEGNWYLVLKTDLVTSLKGFYRARNYGIAVMLCSAVVILLAALVVVHTLVNRIARAEDERMVLGDKVREVEKMALVGRLAASVAHEINNPLQVIGAQAGWMGELLSEGAGAQAGNHEEYRQAVGKITEQVRRAGAITQRLLGYSRAPEKKWSRTDINQTVEETILLLEKAALASRIRIVRDYRQGLPSLETDAGQLQQVFLNLLNNAVDAIGHDGEIRVATSVEGNTVIVQFADTGPGIDAHVLEKIFTPFFTTKEKGKGTGLGLSLSRSIVERLHGNLSVANREGGGCVFTVSLDHSPRLDGNVLAERLAATARVKKVGAWT